jgi:hypothetical protein
MLNPNELAVLQSAQKVVLDLKEKLASANAQIAELTTKVAGYERREEAVKLASRLEDAGLLAGQTMEEKIASVLQHPDFSALNHAVDLASNGGIKIASLSDERDGSSAESAFLAFLNSPTN